MAAIPISHDAIPPFVDLLEGFGPRVKAFDLFLQSPGGDIDKAEKIVYLCRARTDHLRVIVPESAKSAATLIALAADQIIMGYTSELGPIDPQIEITLPDGSHILRSAQSFLDGIEGIVDKVKDRGMEILPIYFPLLLQIDPALLDYCEKAINRAKKFAEKWLTQFMFKEDPSRVSRVVDKLMDVQEYLSHGKVIDADEAQRQIGLNVEILSPSDELWQMIWQLYCLIDIDMKQKSYHALFESEKVSIQLTY